MATEEKNEGKSSGVSIGDMQAGDSFKLGDIVSGDKIGHDKITFGNVKNSTIATSSGQVNTGAALGEPELIAMLTDWQVNMMVRIEALSELEDEEKEDLKTQIGKIKQQVSKLQTDISNGKVVNPNRLEKLINTLGVMGPDIFDVAVSTLINPLTGVGLTLRKISDRVKLEQQEKSS